MAGRADWGLLLDSSGVGLIFCWDPKAKTYTHGVTVCFRLIDAH